MIVLAVRWYLRFGLSYRDVEELLTERGFEADHVTVFHHDQPIHELTIDRTRHYQPNGKPRGGTPRTRIIDTIN